MSAGPDSNKKRKEFTNDSDIFDFDEFVNTYSKGGSGAKHKHKKTHSKPASPARPDGYSEPEREEADADFKLASEEFPDVFAEDFGRKPTSEAPPEKSPEPIKPTEKTPEPIKQTEKAPEPIKQTEKAPEPIKPTEKTSEPIKQTEKAPEPIKQMEKAPEPIKQTEKAPEPIKQTEKAPEPIKQMEKAPEPIKPTEKAPEPIKQTEKAPEPIKETEKAPEPIKQTEKAPEPIKQTQKAPEPIMQTQKAPEPIKQNEPEKSTENKHEPIKPQKPTADVRREKTRRDKQLPVITMDEQGDSRDSIMKVLGYALDEDISELEEISTDSGTDEAKSDSRLRPFIIGLAFTVLAIVGLVFSILSLADFIGGLSDNTKQKTELEKFLLPIVITDPAEFSQTNKLSDQTMLMSAIWDIVINGGTDKYERDTATTNMFIPKIDVELHASNLFGDNLSFVHQTLGTADLRFFYDAETEKYTVPVNPTAATYTPLVEKLDNVGETYTVTVGYQAARPLWSIDDEDYVPQIVKRMKYTITKRGSSYTLIGIDKEQ